MSPATNQLSSASYDANGNMTSGAGATLAYNVDNRLVSAAETSGGIEYYFYAADGKRVWRQLANGTHQFTFYGAYGERLGVYTDAGAGCICNQVEMNVVFAGKVVWQGLPGTTGASGVVMSDRVGTNRNAARFYPFGDEITSTTNDRLKFATYTRDSYTGLDYANQRFYANTYGRFNTTDLADASLENPQSWNRYGYVGGDPINRNDPSGLCSSEEAFQNYGQCPDGSQPGVDEGGYGNCPSSIYNPDGSCGGGNGSGCVISAFNPVADPSCYSGGPTVAVGTSTSGPQPLCPLDPIVGNFNVGSGSKAGPVNAMFAPAMAEALDEAILILNDEGITPTITSGFRTAAQQANAAGGGSGGNPAAPVGLSWHEVGLAVDISMTNSSATNALILNAMADAGLTWGGTFTVPKPDKVHFQLPAARTSAAGVSSGAPSPFQVANCEREHP